MKERPILFNADMVRAILDGQKTQTRRTIKDQPEAGEAFITGKKGLIHGEDVLTPEQYSELCPFGKAGDRLWVKETWTTGKHLDHVRPRDIPDSQSIGYIANTNEAPWDGKIRKSIHMPRWASRILLEITRIRVEKLHSLKALEWEEEGIDYCMEDPDTIIGRAFSEAEHYAIAGVSMNGSPEDHGMRAHFYSHGIDWYQNPWVWVIEFRRLDNE